MPQLYLEQREFHVRKSFRGFIDVFISGYSNKLLKVSKPAEFDDHAESECFPLDPLFKMTATEAQSVMDQLWDCGIRPTEGAGSAGSMSATVKHLEDMRRIVSKKLDIPL